MKTVYTCFCTDIIHDGHRNILREAAKLGRVVVGVLSDPEMLRYNRFPTRTLAERMEMLRAEELVDEVVGIAEIPLVVEGRVHTPAQAAAAMEHGAFAVVVGTAITHPTTITSWFANALPGAVWKG